MQPNKHAHLLQEPQNHTNGNALQRHAIENNKKTKITKPYMLNDASHEYHQIGVSNEAAIK
jgi:hypothetical protein